MEIDPTTNLEQRGIRPCSWCGAGVPVLCRPGRPRLYCNHACRQRAYEHRHGFRHQRTVLPLPGQVPVRFRPDTNGYERGGATVYGGRAHALRTSVRPDGHRRETLCGVLATPVPGRMFSPSDRGSCAKCRTVAAANPLTYPIEASNELSRLRAFIVEGLEQRHPPVNLAAWLRARVVAGRAG